MTSRKALLPPTGHREPSRKTFHRRAQLPALRKVHFFVLPAAMLGYLTLTSGCWWDEKPPVVSPTGTTASGSLDPEWLSPITFDRVTFPHGRFEGQVVASWNDDGRDMTLRENFTYIDPDGKHWHAPAGAVINGASIPQAFWSIIGGPFEGPYRNASVIHDVACCDMREPWQDVHRAFYHACLCGGVGESKAKLMYWAVYRFGPRWEIVDGSRVMFSMAPDAEGYYPAPPARFAMPLEMPEMPDEELIRQAEAFFASENPSLEEIEHLEF